MSKLRDRLRNRRMTVVPGEPVDPPVLVLSDFGQTPEPVRVDISVTENGWTVMTHTQEYIQKQVWRRNESDTMFVALDPLLTHVAGISYELRAELDHLGNNLREICNHLQTLAADIAKEIEAEKGGGDA